MKKTLERRHLTKSLLIVQAAAIIGLLLWLYRESQANDFMKAWLSRNFPAGLALLNEWAVAGIGSGLAILTLQLLGFPQFLWTLYRKRQTQGARTAKQEGAALTATLRGIPTTTAGQPFYETVNLPQFIISLALLTQAASLWFITAAEFRISEFPPNSYYYLTNLPIVYWWGLAATLATILLPVAFGGRGRTVLELTGLFLLAQYLIGLPSFTYQDPRFLDAYYHTGNALDLLNSMGWLSSPNWYAHQFPGAFSYVAQLATVAGIDPFQLMKYFPAGLSILVVFFAYVIARMFSPNNAAIASSLILGGFWFQLHVSPQAFELPLYLGFLFVVLKAIDDSPRRNQWNTIAIVAVPIFVGSHPETPIAFGLGFLGFLVLSLIVGGVSLRELQTKIAIPMVALTGLGVLWWSFIAVDARKLVQASIIDRVILNLSQLPGGISPQNVPTTPEPSYALTLFLEQLTAVIIWGGGILLLLFIRGFQTRERLLYGLFLASVATIPIAAFARADVLQRSYLFALIPFGILAAWLLERRGVLKVRGKSFYPVIKGALIISMVLFVVLIPVTRYGVDPFQYIPSSALTTDAIAAEIRPHSILFLHPEEDGWRFYAGLNGATSQPNVEPTFCIVPPGGLPPSSRCNLLLKSGGYFKPNSDPTVTPFNLTYTRDFDGTADYIVLSDYYVNVYVLRFGPASLTFMAARHSFERNVTENFDLVYSTGLDRLYAHRSVP